MRLRPALLFITLFTLSCEEMPLNEKDRSKISDDIKNMLQNYNADVKRMGLTAEFKYLDDSPEFFWVPPGFASPLKYDSVAVIINRNAAKYSSVQNSFETLKINPVSRKLAIYTGRLHCQMVEVNGGRHALVLMETGVLVKRADGWKLLSGQTSILDKK